MSAPFRELFVELPPAVFEALRDIKEGVAAAPEPSHALSEAPRRPPWWESRTLLMAMSERYGWRGANACHRPHDGALDLEALLMCGHTSVVRIDGHTVLLAQRRPDELIDALDRIVADVEQRCSCVRKAE